MKKSALIQGLYRYHLTRDWSTPEDSRLPVHEVNTVVFIMLNPSTADHTKDDPTVRSCIRLAKTSGFNRLVIVNLYAYRATDPREIKQLPIDTAIGPKNDHHIKRALNEANMVICGWGRHAEMSRVKKVLDLISEYELLPYVLAMNQAGSPRHPLYVSAKSKPYEWLWPQGPLWV